MKSELSEHEPGMITCGVDGRLPALDYPYQQQPDDLERLMDYLPDQEDVQQPQVKAITV